MFEPFTTTGVSRRGAFAQTCLGAERGRAAGRPGDYELWFGPGPLPAPDELAARYGDPAGLGVHPGPESVRYLWLDRWLGLRSVPGVGRRAGLGAERGG